LRLMNDLRSNISGEATCIAGSHSLKTHLVHDMLPSKNVHFD